MTTGMKQLMAGEGSLSPHEGSLVWRFVEKILHGDGEHVAWLLESAQAFIEGREVSKPRGESGRVQALRAVKARLMADDLPDDCDVIEAVIDPMLKELGAS